MKNIYLFILLLFLSLLYQKNVSAQGQWQWGRKTSAVTNSGGTGVKYDPVTRHCYAIGHLNNNANYILACYDENGSLLWSVNSGNALSSGVKVSCLSIDPSGNIIIAGIFSTPFILVGNDTVFNNLTSHFPWFYAVFDSTGNSIDHGIMAESYYFDDILSISVNQNHELFFTGLFSDTIFAGTDTIIDISNQSEIFFGKYDMQNDSLYFIKEFKNTYYDQAWKVLADANGNCYVTCHYAFGPMVVNTDTFAIAGDWNGLLLKFDSDGNILWSKNMASTNEDLFNLMAFDPNGNLIVQGYAGLYTAIPDTNITTLSSGNILLRYSPSGSLLGMKAVGGYNLNFTGIDVDINGNVFLTGGVAGSIALDGFSVSANSPNTSYYKLFVTKLNAQLQHEWVDFAYGRIEQFNLQTISCSDSACYLTGGFYDTLAVANDTLLQNGTGMFVTKLGWSGCSAKSLQISTTGNLCVNGALLLTCDSSGFQKYFWKDNFVSTTPFRYVSQPDTVYVYALDTNTNCVYHSPDFIVPFINATAPAVTVTPDNTQYICNGDSVLYTSTTCNGCTYQWYSGYNNPIAGQTFNTYYQAAQGQTMIWVDSGSCSVLAYGGPVVVFSITNPVIIQNGNLLQCTNVFASYQWYLNGNLLAGEDADTLVITLPGFYELIVTDNNGCETSAGITVTSAETNSMTDAATVWYSSSDEKLKIKQAARERSCLIEVTDIAGRTLLKEKFYSNYYEVSTCRLPEGMYIYKLQTETKQIAGKFFKE